MIYSVLPTTVQRKIESWFRFEAQFPEQLNEKVVEFDGVSVTRRMIMQFDVGKAITVDVISVLSRLFQLRDQQISRNYQDVHSNKANITPFKRSLYLDDSHMDFIVENPSRTDFNELIRNDISWEVLKTVIILFKLSHYCENHTNKDEDDWSLLYINVIKREIILIIPNIDWIFPSDEIMERANNVSQSISEVFNTFLHVMIPSFIGTWKCTLCPQYMQNFQCLENDYDSGIYVIMIAYFITCDCPLGFHMSESTSKNIRLRIARWILEKRLPI